jgi:hypothetical protein
MAVFYQQLSHISTINKPNMYIYIYIFIIHILYIYYTYHISLKHMYTIIYIYIDLYQLSINPFIYIHILDNIFVINHIY